MPAILVRDLRKEYGDVRAVDGLGFHVATGEVYANGFDNDNNLLANEAAYVDPAYF